MVTEQLTKVSSEDFSEAVCDKYGLYYSKDYKRLLSYMNPLKEQFMIQRISKIIIHPLTEVICEDAFRDYGFYEMCYDDTNIELVLPERLKVIGANAFTGSCFSSVLLPKSLDTIYGNPFAFSEISKINNYSNHYKIHEGILYDSAMECVIHCFSKIESFISCTQTTCIRDAAFACQPKLKTAILSCVETIGNLAFYNCPNLEYVSLTDKLKTIGEKAFKQRITSLNEIESGHYFENEKKTLKSIPLEIQIPANTKFIGKEAFARVTKIKSKSHNFIIENNLLLSSDRKVIYNCLSSPPTIVIPDTVEYIMGCAFEGNQNIERLIIPSTVKYIGDKAFRYCYKLKSVYFESKDVELGISVFSDCVNLKYLTLPRNIKEIPEGTFRHCPKIDNLIFPDSIISIGEGAFCDCSFQELKMPRELKKIERNAFENCKALRSLTLNEEIEEIGSFVFRGCDKIKELYLPKSIRKIGANAFNIQKKVTISNPSTLIEHDGLGGGWHELIIQIPTRHVWNMVCYHEIKSYWHIVPLFKEWTFEERLSGLNMGTFNFMNFDEYGHPVKDYTKPGIYSGDMECFISLFDNYSHDSVNKIILDKSVKYVCNRAFVNSDCGMPIDTNIKPVVLPDSVIAIGNNAFERISLEKINLPKNLKYIGDLVFKDSKFNEKIIIPEMVSHIGINPFANSWQRKYHMEIECLSPHFNVLNQTLYTNDMTRLIYCFNQDEELIIPDKVESIDDYAFSHLPLKSIIIPYSVKHIGNNAFAWCEKLETINISNVRTIGEGCFQGCKSLKKILLPYSNILNSYMFAHCENLKSITINNHTEFIDECAFKDCTNLSQIVLPENIIQIGESVFAGSGIKRIICETSYFETKDNMLFTKGLRTLIYSFNKKSKIIIPEGVVEISNEAFANRKEMKSIVFPSSLLKLGKRVFVGCSNLKVVDLRKTNIIQLDKFTFACCNSNPEVLRRQGGQF